MEGMKKIRLNFISKFFKIKIIKLNFMIITNVMLTMDIFPQIFKTKIIWL